MFLLLTQVSQASRYALVIGNSNYNIGSLKNPVNDAIDMTNLLQKKGFKVQRLINANEKQMKQGIRQFTNRLHQKNVVGLFYYAGHGIEVGGHNYLIPLGANIENENDVEFESVDAGRVMAGMEKAGNNLNIVILDACRNNPFARSFRSSSRGLGRMDAAKGSLVLYATSPGDVASDGEGRNGVFTKHLITSINQATLTVEQVFKQTAKKVYQATGGKQTPWQSGVIIDEFYFTINAPQAKTVTIDTTETNSNQAEIVFWESIKNESTPEFFKSYLQEYPSGVYATLAKLKIQRGSSLIAIQPKTKTEQRKLRLVISTRPINAKIRVLNITSKYHDGIALKPGRYHIEVSHTGYQRKREWFTLSTENKVHLVELTKKNISVKFRPESKTKDYKSNQQKAIDAFNMM